MSKWIFYNLTVGFSVYWLSNLFLWFPWSINPWFGITLMLTISPILWAGSTFLCLRTFPKKNLISAAALNALIFLFIAVTMDYLFFGLIRNAMEDLYHPTTFYGYGFLICLPVIEVMAFRKKIKRYKKDIVNSDFVKPATIGVICLTMLTLIITFRIEL